MYIYVYVYSLSIYKFYDKRDSFPFEIVGVPFFNNNIPSQIFYSFTGSEISRLARNTSGRLLCVMLVKKLLDRISKQGNLKMDIKILLNLQRQLSGCHTLFKL